MLTNIRYILLTALRDWLFALLMAGLITCMLIAHMLGDTALIEMQEMALAYTSASVRVVVVTGLIIFVCFHIRNAFDTKEIEVFLSRPITRSNLILSYWTGFAVVALLLVIPAIILVALQGIMNVKGFIFWSASLLVECWLVVAVALLASFALKSAITSTMATMGFYVFSRMMGFFIAVSAPGVFAQRWVDGMFGYMLKAASVVIPRLDSFAKSDWLIYGLKDVADYRVCIVQAGVLIPLLILAAVADFRRKQF